MSAACDPPRRALVAGLFTAAPTGSFYGFSVYSQALKAQFDLSQQQLASINTIPYALGFGSPLAGAVMQSCGPAFTTALGGAFQASGQLLMFGVAVKALPVASPSVALVLCACINYVGMALNNAAAFTNPVLHYPVQRSSVTGLVKSFVGISGAVVTQVFVLFYGTPGPDPEALLCLLIWAASSVSCCALSALLVPRAPDPSAREPVGLLRVCFYYVLGLGLFATVVSFLPEGSAHDASVITLSVATVLPVAIAFMPCTERRSDPFAATAAKGSQTGVFECATSYTTREMLSTPDAWMIWYVGVVVAGSGMILSTNLAQIIESAGAPQTLVPTAVTLFSVGNLLGRLLGMQVSDRVVHSGHSRALMLSAISALMGISQLGFVTAAAMRRAGSTLQRVVFLAATSGGGLSFGAIWPHFVVLASEIFGSAHLAKNYMFFDGTCGALGSLVFANVLPSTVYALSAVGNDCVGASCFGPTHGISVLLCAVGCVLGAMLAKRSAPLYERILRSRTELV